MTQSTSEPNQPQTRRFRLGSLLWLGLVTVLAAGSVIASMFLREHADARRESMDQLARLETKATEHSRTVWRAMTMLMADERMPFVRIRGEAQQRAREIHEQLESIAELEKAGQKWNKRLGLQTRSELMEAVEDSTSRFLGSVQGTFGQMSLSSQRMRDRLRYWDMGFGQFSESLAALREHQSSIAKDSAKAANQATLAAALVTLLAACFGAIRLARMRSRRRRELHQEHLRTLSASEARFRELVQNSSDLILVVEEDGRVRYATPSLARQLEEQLGDRAQERGSVEELFGLSVSQLLAETPCEVALAGSEGSAHTFEMRASDLRHQSEIGGIVLNARDITERKALEDRLRFQALHDPLTGLPNRRQFKLCFEEASPEEINGAAVLFIDLDGFKRVNDSYGHQAGDNLLGLTAQRIGTCLADGDLLARQGGDEFLLLAMKDPGDLASRILRALEAPFQFDGKEIFISASIGAVRDLSDCSADDAAQRADIAMYQAKQKGKAQSVEFEEAMLAEAPERLQLESDFRRALERDEFMVYYQPKVGLNSGKTESLEALVRWDHPTRGFVRPDEFISFAEEAGLISELGRIVLEQACHDAVRWQDQGVVVAVNLSPLQFRNPKLIEEVQNALDQSGLDPKHLELEITESAVLGDVDQTIAMLAELKALGCRLAIDDFGTGYSNLSHLKHFNVDVLKIDQAFVRGGGALEHLSDGAIVEAVIGMAKAFDLHVVAEGVESQSHANDLRDLGADLGQGFFFSKPVPATTIDSLLAKENDRRAA